ncbi:MAG: DUF2469 family protein [Varibaculum sp.]|nr:DUF2469 family protein [Varibaculum sp.]
MGEQDIDSFESDLEMQLVREYRDVVKLFRYVVETERRFYLANRVKVTPQVHGADALYELEMEDVWVWDVFRPSRFVNKAKVITYRDVNVEELAKQDITIE